MNAEPLIPLPKKKPNESLKPVQLLMVFLLWAFVITLGISTFMAEFGFGAKTKQGWNSQVL